MLRRRPTVAFVAVATTLGLSLATVGGAQAATTTKTKTVTACVSKKSGTTKVLLGKKAKKKCKKGWTKVKWSVAGTNGKNGKNGTNGTNGVNGASGINGKDGVALQVRDANGTVIGTYAGLYPAAPFAIYTVLGPDGGLYNYLPTGQLFVSVLGSASPIFKDSACTGQAYLDAGTGLPAGYLDLFQGPTRLVFRTTSGALTDLGPARVWKFTVTTETVAAPVGTYYELDSGTGACTALSGGDVPSVGDTLVLLTSIPAPPDGVGPLTLG